MTVNVPSTPLGERFTWPSCRPGDGGHEEDLLGVDEPRQPVVDALEDLGHDSSLADEFASRRTGRMGGRCSPAPPPARSLTLPGPTSSRTGTAASSTSARPRASAAASTTTSSTRRCSCPAPGRWSPPPRAWSGSRSTTRSRRCSSSSTSSRQHKPRFNIRLKDDKSYPYLAVTVGEEWPRAMVMRGAKRKGVRYYGPFAHAYAIRETLDLLLRTFPIRTCTDNKLERHRKLGRPCLYAHIEKCSAPCVDDITPADYDTLVGELLDFLDGQHRDDRRAARGRDAGGGLGAGVRAGGPPAGPAGLGPQGHRTPADGGRQGRGLRRHRPGRGRPGGVGPGLQRPPGPDGGPQGAGRWRRSRSSRPPALSARILEMLYGDARRRGRAQGGADPRRAGGARALRGVPVATSGAPRCGSGCRSGATSGPSSRP